MTYFPKGQNQTLSEYALTYFHDTHALDIGAKRRRQLDYFLNKTYQSIALESHGIIDNIASISVWSKGVFSNDFTGISLLTLDQQALLDINVVWMFENQNTATRILRDGYDFPFIISSGQPNRAVKQLVQRLLDNHVTILYHGDLDISGVDIASRLKAEFPRIQFPFFTTKEFLATTIVDSPKQQRASSNASQFEALKQLISSSNTVVYEEQLDLKRCQQRYKAELLLKR